MLILSLLKPIQYTQPDESAYFTIESFKHTPYSFCFCIKCSFDNELSKLVHYRGSDAAEIFVALLEKMPLNYITNI